MSVRSLYAKSGARGEILSCIMQHCFTSLEVFILSNAGFIVLCVLEKNARNTMQDALLMYSIQMLLLYFPRVIKLNLIKRIQVCWTRAIQEKGSM